jgi:hypothetical protein
MRAGFHETDITPPIGMEVPGGYGKAYVNQIHDPLKVRAAVIDDGKEKVALVGVDTCELQSVSVMHAIRKRLEDRTGIPADHVLIAASHTHSGGPFSMWLLSELGELPEQARQLFADYSPVADKLYFDWVVGQIVTAVEQANTRREEALLSVGSGHEQTVSYNRRFRMKSGRSYTHPGKGNPDILEPAGPIDPEVGVVAAWAPGGNLLGCIVNFACHGTTFGGGGISSDWIGYMNGTVMSAMGTDCPAVFLPGAAGDITQVDNQSMQEREFGEKWSRHVGSHIGAEVVKVLVTAERGDLSPVDAVSKTLRFKRRLPSKERLAQCKKVVEEGLKGGRTGTTEWTFAKEIVLLDYLTQKQPEALVEVQAVQIGPIIFLANSSEYFCELGLDIKRRSSFPFTYVVSLANGSSGYIPTVEAFAPTGGGYETVLTSYSNAEITAGPKIADDCIALSKAMTPGAMPQIPQVERVGEPWGYGILGPDA